MRASQLFFLTLRTTPGDDRLPGQQLLLRAGLVRPLTAHDIAFLPLGVMVRRRIEHLARVAFAAHGAQEMALPSRADAPAALLAVAGTVVQSYRQLPAWLYEVQPDPGDDGAGGGGLFAARQGLMADLYGLLADPQALHAATPAVVALLEGVIARCGVPALTVMAGESADGPAAHSLVYLHDPGDRVVLRCPGCGYAADQEAARRAMPPPAPEAPLSVEAVATPDCKTIADLARFLGVPESRTAKAVFLAADAGGPDRRFIFAVVRGDTDLNEAKLRRALGVTALSAATEEEIRRAGAEPGYGSPVGLSGVTVVVDDLVAMSPNLVAGANRPGYHLRNVNYGRDYTATLVTDIALARADDPCPACATPMQALCAVELGRVEALGDAPGATYLDREGATQPVSLLHARLHLDRLLGAAAETHHDDHGLTWPPQIAPFQVYLMTAGKPLPEVTDAAERLYTVLQDAGYDVLYDDRDERAGVKFNDADLLGIPARVVAGERGLREGTVEVKPRTATEVEAVRVEALVERLKSLLQVQPDD